MYISALIAQHGRLDAVAQNDPEICNILNSFTGGRPLSEFLFEKFLGWSGVQNDFQKDSQKLPILCLGALFCGYPQLILGTKTDQWMTTIAQSNNMENKAHLLVLLRAFLDSEVERRESAASTTKDVNDLIGSASDLHESSISTALVQRNMEFIIDGAKSSLSALRSAAMDVLSFTIKHGLYHPLKVSCHFCDM